MGRILQISVGAGAEIVGALIVGAIIVGASASVLVPRAVNWSCQTMSCYIGMLNYVGPH